MTLARRDTKRHKAASYVKQCLLLARLKAAQNGGKFRALNKAGGYLLLHDKRNTYNFIMTGEGTGSFIIAGYMRLV